MDITKQHEQETLNQMRDELYNLICDLDELDFIDFGKKTHCDNVGDLSFFLDCSSPLTIRELYYYYSN